MEQKENFMAVLKIIQIMQKNVIFPGKGKLTLELFSMTGNFWEKYLQCASNRFNRSAI